MDVISILVKLLIGELDMPGLDGGNIQPVHGRRQAKDIRGFLRNLYSRSDELCRRRGVTRLWD
jgi:hypothetical protein